MKISDYKRAFKCDPPEFRIKGDRVMCNCGINEAVLGMIQGSYAVMECEDCTKKKGHINFYKGSKVKNIEDAAALVQPWRNDEPSAEFAKLYPKQASKIFKNETKPLRNVYGGDSLRDLR